MYKCIEDFSFHINLVSFPLLDNYRRSFRTFGPHQYSEDYTDYLYGMYNSIKFGSVED